MFRALGWGCPAGFRFGLRVSGFALGGLVGTIMVATIVSGSFMV